MLLILNCLIKKKGFKNLSICDGSLVVGHDLAKVEFCAVLSAFDKPGFESRPSHLFKEVVVLRSGTTSFYSTEEEFEKFLMRTSYTACPIIN